MTTKPIVHDFISPKADGPDPTLLQPSYWNDGHEGYEVGLDAARPATPDAGAGAMYWATDTARFSLWDGADWRVFPARLPDCNYLFDVVGGVYLAWNKETGKPQFSGTTAHTVINAALNAVSENTDNYSRSGGLFIFGPGQYIITGSIIGTKYGTVLSGLGHGQTSEIRQGGNFTAGRGLIEIGGAVAGAGANDHLHNCAVRNLSITGGRATGHTGGHGIVIYGSDCTVVDCSVNNTAESGIVVQGAGQTSFQVRILDNTVTQCDGHGIVIESTVSDYLVAGNEVNGGAPAGGTSITTYTQYGFYVKGGAGVFVANHAYFCERGLMAENGQQVFIGCRFETNSGAGAYVNGADRVWFDHCQFYGNDIQRTGGFTPDSTDVYVTGSDIGGFSKCWFSNPKGGIIPATGIDRQIHFVNSTRWVVASTDFEDCATGGSHVTASGTCNRLRIVNNNMMGGSAGTPTKGILFTGSGVTRNIVTGNEIAGTISLENGTDQNDVYRNDVGAQIQTTNNGGAGTGNRIEKNRGSNMNGAVVASAGDLDPGYSQYVIVSGTTTINGLRSARFDVGDMITLEFQASCTLKHNTAGSAGYPAVLLNGAADFAGTAGDTITLRWNGTNLREIGRAVI